MIVTIPSASVAKGPNMKSFFLFANVCTKNSTFTTRRGLRPESTRRSTTLSCIRSEAIRFYCKGRWASNKHWRLTCYQGRERAIVCSFDQTGARAFRQNVESFSNQRNFVRTICTAGWYAIRRCIWELRKCSEQDVGHPAVFFHQKAGLL